MKVAGLSQDSPGSHRSKKSVAIVTTDFDGPTKNSGVGTACLCLAEALARNGHDVTVVFADAQQRSQGEIAYWEDYFARSKIHFARVTHPGFPLDATALSSESYATYEFIKNRAFEIIHFPETNGLGYYSLLAKKTGCAFSETLLCVNLYAPLLWRREGEDISPSCVTDLETAYLERKSAEMADVLIAPNRHILDWARAAGWKLPRRTYTEPCLFPIAREAASRRTQRSSFPEELAFFGRLESRKGIDIFCSALELLPKDALQGRRVTFLGRFNLMLSPEIKNGFLGKLQENSFEWRVLSGLSREEALDYMRTARALAVIPSRAEALGYAAVDCLSEGVPFIASRIPAFQALLTQASQRSHLFENTPEALSRMLLKVIRHGFPPPPRPAADRARTESNWVRWHDRVQPRPRSQRKSPNKQPLVSVCMTHRDRPRLLLQCLDSIRDQTYPRLEVILVDDASTTRQAREALRGLSADFRKRGWKIVRNQRSLGPGGARNRAAQLASGEFLLFQDSDDVAKPWEIKRLVRAASLTRADLVTCCADRFSGLSAPNAEASPSSRLLAVGDDLLTGVFENVFGTANFLVRKSTFARLRGFQRSSAHEDWEFLARAVLKGCRLVAVPEALFWYRRHPGNLSRTIGPMEAAELRLRTYARVLNSPDLLQTLTDAYSYYYKFETTRKRETKRALLVILELMKLRLSNSVFAPRTLREFREVSGFSSVKGDLARGGLRLSGGPDSYLTLATHRTRPRRVLITGAVTRSNASAVAISYRRPGQPMPEMKICTTQPGKSEFHFLLDGRRIHGPIRFLPNIGSETCVLNAFEVFIDE